MPSNKKRKETDRNIHLGDANVYPVEKLLDSRVISRKTEYLVKWKGYSSDFNQWISAVNINPVLKKKFKEQRKLAKIGRMNENASPKHGVNKANRTSPLPKKKLKAIEVEHPEIMKEASSTTPSTSEHYNLRKRKRPSETTTSRAMVGSELDVLTIPIEKSQVIDFEEFTSQIFNESSVIRIFGELMSNLSVLETMPSPDSMIQKMANKLDTEEYTAQTKLQGLTESQMKLQDEDNKNIISELDTCDLQMSNESKDVQNYKDSFENVIVTAPTSFNMEAAIPQKSCVNFQHKGRCSNVCEDSDFILHISSESSASDETMQSPENMIQKVAMMLDMDACTPQTEIADMATRKTSRIEEKENCMIDKIERHTSNGSKTLQIFNSEICKTPSTFYIDSKNDKTTTKFRRMKKSRDASNVSDESDDIIYQDSYKIPRRATLKSVLDIPMQSKALKVLPPMRKEDLEDEDDERHLLRFDVSMSPVLL